MQISKKQIIFTIILLLFTAYLVPLIKIQESQIVQNSVSYSLQPYNIVQSKRLAKHAGICYCPKQTVSKWSCKPCQQIPKFTDLTYIDSSIYKIVGYMGYDPQNDWIIASWRGTDNPQNLIIDLQFKKVLYQYCRGCQVHEGFLIAYRSVHHKAAEVMKQLINKHPNSKIIVTGHSLGGALATLSALQLTITLNIGFDRLILHNFGAPRVGNDRFAAYVKSKIGTSYRVVRDKDYAPHLPPQSFQYKQQPYQVWFNKDMTQYKICDQSGEDKNCSNQYYPKYSFDQHWYYFQNIKNDQQC